MTGYQWHKTSGAEGGAVAGDDGAIFSTVNLVRDENSLHGHDVYFSKTQFVKFTVRGQESNDDEGTSSMHASYNNIHWQISTMGIISYISADKTDL